MTELQSQVAVRIIHLSGAECREPSVILFREVQKSILRRIIHRIHCAVQLPGTAKEDVD